MFWIFENYSGNDLVIAIIAFTLAIFIAMSSHEFSHAIVADRQGDDTPKAHGRVTLNPFAHIDPFGFLSFVLVGFGWAKPVPINPLKFKEYRKGIFLTSIVGIVTNFVLCFFSCGLMVLSLYISFGDSAFLLFLKDFFVMFFSFTATVNLSLCIFNLIPIYPLDGYNVLSSFVKSDNKVLNFIRRYGALILLGLILTGFFEQIMRFLVNNILSPIISFWITVII